ncbi:MAG: TPM domain-containing protein [Clostridiales bacterium]|jgi:uncharacterized protein|nr:TPM domain-containing protein [Clostridiales bacterium]
MKKTLFFFILVFLAGSTSFYQAMGSDAYEYVADKADLLLDYEISELNEQISAIIQAHGFDVAIVAIETTDGKSITAYTDDYFDQYGLGLGPDRDGLIFLISMAQRQWHITTHGKCTAIFGGSAIDAIGSSLTPYLSSGDYYSAFETLLERIDSYAFSQPSSFSGGYIEYDESSEERYVGILAVILISLGIALFTVFSMKRQMNTARRQRAAGNFVREGSFNLTRQSDMFVHTHTTRTRKAEAPPSGGGATHTSSGGSRFGGGGGKF